MKKSRRFFYVLITFWFAITISTLVWWFYLILNYSNLNKKMILAEGSILIALIVVGGLSLIIFNFKYIKSKNSNQKFLLTLTHDIKTSLGALLLSIESNERNFSNEQISFKNQKKEILRLNTILENSLLKSKKENIDFYKEKINLMSFFEQMNINFSIFEFKNLEPYIYFDKRYLELMVRNILYNSIKHGGADKIFVTSSTNLKYINLTFKDNGSSVFNLERDSLASGLGLKLIQKLIISQKGFMSYKHYSDGFIVNLSFRK
jgi:signal transduction histidine kinase